MEIHFSAFSLLFLVSTILGFLTSYILLTFPRQVRSPNRWLGIALFGISWGQLAGFLLESGLIFHVPHFFRTGFLFALIYLPTSYLYVRQVIAPRPLSARDLIHAVPILIFLVDYLPFFLSSADVKIAALMSELSLDPPVNRYNEGWLLPDNTQEWMWFMAALVYWVREVRLLMKLRGPVLRFRARKSKAWRWWLTSFLFFQSLIFLPWHIGHLINIDTTSVLLVHGSVFAMLTMTVLTLLFKPEILYGLKSGAVSHSNSKGDGYHPAPENPVVDLHENIAALMEQQKIFLKHRYAMADMAHDLGVPPHQLSHQLNSLLKISFNDLMNEYRVKHCLERIRNENIERITLEALALECGFNNRNSFTQAVKKVTGKTPSALIRQRRNPSMA